MSCLRTNQASTRLHFHGFLAPNLMQERNMDRMQGGYRERERLVNGVGSLVSTRFCVPVDLRHFREALRR